MTKSKLLFILFIFFTSQLFSQISIKERFFLQISINKNSFPRAFYIGPAKFIYEGFGSELIIPQDTYFEVFSSKGKFIKRVGGKGKGPGDFINIISIKKNNSYLFIQDYPNGISFFDKRYKFIKRKYLKGINCSNFIAFFDVGNNNFYCSQLSYLKKEEKCIQSYNFKGKFIGSFLKRKFGSKKYPISSLLQGKILVIKKSVFFAFQSIPRIWKLNFKGEIIDSVYFGGKWWREINYSEKDYKIRRKKKGRKAILDLMLSGDFIYQLRKYKDNIIVHIVRNGNDYNPINCFVAVNTDFDKISKLIKFKDYDFSGSGQFIYMIKEIKPVSNKGRYEVLKCELNF